MSDMTIGQYDAAATIDGSTHYLLIQPGNASTAYKKINRNVLLGLSGAPVGTTDSQALTNKTIGNTNTVTVKDTLFTLQDDGDTTKQARFELSSITTATTRTYTLPNASSTLADIATAQTLTNKTLTSPVISGGSITGTTITTDAIVGQTSGTSGTVYGLSVAAAKISGASITNATIPTAAIADSAVTPAKLLTGTGSTWVWQSWTPTLTNLSGGTTTVAKYNQTGKTVTARFKYTLGGAGVAGVPRLTLPVNANATYVVNDTIMVTGQYNDVTGSRWIPTILVASVSAIDLYYINSTPTINAITATQPFTWAVSDFIDITITYEAA